MFLNWMSGKIRESPLDCKEIKTVNPKGNQSWIFIGRTDAEVETPIFGHLMQRIDSFEKTLMLGKIEGGRRRRQQRMMAWLDGISNLMDMSLSKLWDLVMDGGSLVCCSPWGLKESDTIKWLNWLNTQMLWIYIFSIKNSRCIIVSHNASCLSKYMHKYGRIFIM